jgi:hypothetical protein
MEQVPYCSYWLNFFIIEYAITKFPLSQYQLETFYEGLEKMLNSNLSQV